MAIAFRAASTLDIPADDLTWDIPTPTGTQDGDLLLAFVVSAATAQTVPTPPTGWTIVQATQLSPTPDCRGYLYRRTASSEPASTVFTWAGGTTRTGAACMVAYSGVHATPLNGSAQLASGFASSTTPAGAPLTPSIDNCMVVAFFACDQAAAATWTKPAGYEERVDFQDTGPLVSLGVFDKLQTSAGPETPTPTTTVADEGIAFTVALAPAAVAATTRNRRFFLMGQRDPFIRRGR